MHYVKFKTRVRVYLHDTKDEDRVKVTNYLNKNKVNYKYIRSITCFSLSIKDEYIARVILQLLEQ